MDDLALTFVGTEFAEAPTLLARAQAGDAGAYGGLCRVHEARLIRQAMTLCGNPALAEDLAQDTLVEAWRCLRRYNGRCQFFTWLCAILLNRHRNTLREKRPVPLSALGARERDAIQDRAAQLADPSSTPDQAAESLERAVLLRQSVETLPEKLQQVIYLRFYVDDSLEEIAAALDCPVGTVKSRLYHALEKLRRRAEILNSKC